MFGVRLPKVKDEHTAAVATRMLARKGFRIARTMDKAGAIIITAQFRAVSSRLPKQAEDAAGRVGFRALQHEVELIVGVLVVGDGPVVAEPTNHVGLKTADGVLALVGRGVPTAKDVGHEVSLMPKARESGSLQAITPTPPRDL
jgi:hypothetical protein